MNTGCQTPGRQMEEEDVKDGANQNLSNTFGIFLDETALNT